jgi:hypothetical protein
MNHFNFKSLTFYGVAISSVLILFKAVTAYGETKLQAPTKISDRYLLTLAAKLPDCQQTNSLVLNIQQSGIYLNASLLPTTANADTEKQLPLTGILKNQQLSLSGNIDSSTLCNLPPTQKDPTHSIKIQMAITDQGDMPGKLILNSNTQTLGFIAQAQTSKKPTPKSNH